MKKQRFCFRIGVTEGQEFVKPGLSASMGPKPLSCFSSGQMVFISDYGGGAELGSRLESLGLIPGAEVKILVNSGHGPLLLAVDNSRFMLGRGMAGAIRAQARNEDKRRK